MYILTRSGGDDSALSDPLGPKHLLPKDASEEAIGLALIDCLSHSRFLPYEENLAFYDLDARLAQDDEWVRFLMEKYKCKSKRALFSGMDTCSVEQFDAKIIIQPNCHVGPLIWVRR